MEEENEDKDDEAEEVKIPRTLLNRLIEVSDLGIWATCQASDLYQKKFLEKRDCPDAGDL